MLLWKRYGNNKMAAMLIMSLILHLQQYSHRLNFIIIIIIRKYNNNNNNNNTVLQGNCNSI